MMLRQALIDDISEIKELWALGFGDKDPFLDFYFTRYFKPAHTMVALDGGRIVSSLQMPPVIFTHTGIDLKAAYVHGVVTHPDHRKRGYAAALVEAAIVQLKKNGCLVCALIPASDSLFNFYRRFGFADVFSVSETKISLADLPQLYEKNFAVKRLDTEKDRLFDFYTSAYRGADFAVLKGKDDFTFFLDEFLAFEGDVYIAENGNGIAACAFVTGKDKKFAKELLYQDKNARDFLIREVLNIIGGQEELLIRTPATKDAANKKPFAMARILDENAFLRAFHKNGEEGFFKELSNKLSIEDFTVLALSYALDETAYKTGAPKLNGYINLMLNE